MALEKELQKVRSKYRTKRLLHLLDDLESLHQIHRMRKFYKVVRLKTNKPKDPSFVIWDPDSSIEKPCFSSTSTGYLENWARYLEKNFSTGRFSTHVFDKENHCPNQDYPITLSKS